MDIVRTLASASRQSCPNSFARREIARRASPLSVHEYLIDEANVRGFRGAYRATTVDRPPDSRLDVEDVLVGLLAPQAPLEARIFKLALRIMQSDELDLDKLVFRAKRERALGPLYWLLQQIPTQERSVSIVALAQRLSCPPRGYRPLDFRFDASRLIKRVAHKEDMWRKPRH